MSRPITIDRSERILAVVPEHCGGPGWSNAPVWVFIVDAIHNTSRTECIQPQEQTPGMRSLFDIGAAVHAALIDAVPTIRTKRTPSKREQLSKQ